MHTWVPQSYWAILWAHGLLLNEMQNTRKDMQSVGRYPELAKLKKSLLLVHSSPDAFYENWTD